ncbi:MAG: EamA family transporter [Ruminiclostridium sp.]|nr:EamA family transporter [Ruminiclostridium sp.]
MDLKFYLPVLIVVLSNTFYHICSKSTPENINIFASLSVTYAVGMVASLVIFFLTRQDTSLLAEYRHLTWTSFVLGLSVVGLEAGFILMYKAGWNVSTGQLVQSALLAIVLLVVGFLLYRESISLRQVIGVFVCMGGLYLMSN